MPIAKLSGVALLTNQDGAKTLTIMLLVPELKAAELRGGLSVEELGRRASPDTSDLVNHRLHNVQGAEDHQVIHVHKHEAQGGLVIT